MRLVQYQRHERWRRRHDRVSKPSRGREPGAVAAGFRQRLTTGCENDALTPEGAGCGHDSKAAAGSLEIDHAAGCKQMNAGRAGTSNERVQDVPCAPTDW